MNTNRMTRNWLVLLLLGAVGVLMACGSAPLVTHTPSATPTPTSTIPPAPTDQAGNGRIAYPWPMQQRTNPATGTIYWEPTDARVYEELETDFLAYWTWSGHAGPTSFPFAPPATLIPLLATPDFQAQLQTYLNQLQSQGNVTAYLGEQGQPAQAIRACTQDGLVCQVYYSFPAATKTVYNTQTGQILAQTKHITLIVLVTQSYNKGTQRWQLSTLVSQELPG